MEHIASRGHKKEAYRGIRVAGDKFKDNALGIIHGKVSNFLKNTSRYELGVQGVSKREKERFAAYNVGEGFGGRAAERAPASVGHRMGEPDPRSPREGKRANNEASKEGGPTMFDDLEAIREGLQRKGEVKIFGQPPVGPNEN